MLNIVDNSAKRIYFFRDLQPGDVFRRLGQDEVYIKTCALNCVPTCNLSNVPVTLSAFCFDEKEFNFIDDNEEVIPYDAELVIYRADY